MQVRDFTRAEYPLCHRACTSAASARSQLHVVRVGAHISRFGLMCLERNGRRQWCTASPGVCSCGTCVELKLRTVGDLQGSAVYIYYLASWPYTELWQRSVRQRGSLLAVHSTALQSSNRLTVLQRVPAAADDRACCAPLSRPGGRQHGQTPWPVPPIHATRRHVHAAQAQISWHLWLVSPCADQSLPLSCRECGQPWLPPGLSCRRMVWESMAERVAHTGMSLWGSCTLGCMPGC